MKYIKASGDGPQNPKNASFLSEAEKISIQMFLILHSGLRLGELLNINVSDVNLEDKEISVPLEKGTTKKVAFDEHFAELLNQYLVDRGPLFLNNR